MAWFREQLAEGLAQLDSQVLLKLSNGATKDGRFGPLARLATTKLAVDGLRALLTVKVAEMIAIGVPRTAIAEALGYASASNLRSQFPQLDDVLAAIERATQRSVGEGATVVGETVTVDGYSFVAGPIWSAN